VGYPSSYLTRSLAFAKASLRGTPAGIRGKHELLDASVNSAIESLHSLTHLNFRIYLHSLDCVLYFPSLAC
jgi:hypothetical protein